MEKPLYAPFKYTGKSKKKFSVYVKNEKGKTRLIHFGDVRYQDFRQHKDAKRRASYLKRAKGIKNAAGELTWKDKNTSNYWSVHYLWDG